MEFNRHFLKRNYLRPVEAKRMEYRQKFLPCDLWGWTALDGAGEYDCHALPDSVSPQWDWKVWGLLT